MCRRPRFWKPWSSTPRRTSTRLAKLKKGNIASEAERLADGSGWMPAIFKAETSETMQEQDNAPAAAEAMADELVQTLAA